MSTTKRYHLTIKPGPYGFPPVQRIVLGGVEFRRQTQRRDPSDSNAIHSYPGCFADLTDEQVAKVQKAAGGRVVRFHVMADEKGEVACTRSSVYLKTTVAPLRDADGRVLKERAANGDMVDVIREQPHPAYQPELGDVPLLSFLGIREVSTSIEDAVSAQVAPEVAQLDVDRAKAVESEDRARQDPSDAAVRTLHGRAKRAGESPKA